jgi:LysM repeat protein
MPGWSDLRRLTIACAALASIGATRVAAQPEMADLREDMHGLTQRVNELSLRVEQLEHENAGLRAKLAAVDRTGEYATSAQLNSALADLNSAIKSSVASSRSEILQQVAAQMETLAKQTNAALDSLAKAGTSGQPRPPAQAQGAKPAFSDSYPKEGVSYTVQKGDSIGAIAKKTGAKAQDIVDANKLAEPSRIQAGQVLFVPGGK